MQYTYFKCSGDIEHYLVVGFRKGISIHSKLLVQYMEYLHEEEHVVVSVIEGYRTTISHTLKAIKEVDKGKDPHLSSLFANFARVSDKQRMTVSP